MGGFLSSLKIERVNRKMYRARDEAVEGAVNGANLPQAAGENGT